MPDAAAGPRLGRAHHPRGLRRHRAQRAWAATSPAPARTRCSTSPPWAEAAYRHFLRNPIAPAPAPQVQDQLLRLRHRLRPGDVQRRRRHRRHPHAATTAPSRPASGSSSPAASAPTRTRRWPSRSSPPARSCSPPSRRAAGLRADRQPRQQAARPHEVGGRQLGFEELQRRDLQGRASSCWPRPPGPAASPPQVEKLGDAPAGVAAGVAATADRPGHAGRAPPAPTPYERWEEANVVRGVAKGTVSAFAWARLGDITAAQFRALAVDPARVRRRGAHHQPPELRVPRPHRGPAARRSTQRLDGHRHGRARRRARPRRRGLPRRRHLQPRRHPVPRPRRRHRRRASRRRASPRSAACASTSPAAPTPAASTTSPTSASSAPSAGPTASRPPATRCCSAATSARRQIEFGEKALRLPGQDRARGRRAGRRAASPTSARPARPSAAGSTASGGAKAVGRRPEGPRRVPHARREPRLLRRLRRDRPVRGRGRRVGVRGLMRRTHRHQRVARAAAGPFTATQFTDDELAELNAEFEHAARRPRSSSGPSTTSAPTWRSTASMTDSVLIDLAVKVDPGDRGRVHRHRLPLPRDARDRRDGAPPLRPQPADHDRAPATTRSSGRSTPRTAARR